MKLKRLIARLLGRDETVFLPLAFADEDPTFGEMVTVVAEDPGVRTAVGARNVDAAALAATRTLLDFIGLDDLVPDQERQP